MLHLVDLVTNSEAEKTCRAILPCADRRLMCLQPIGRASFFPKEKKSDDPPAANLESRLYKYKGTASWPMPFESFSPVHLIKFIRNTSSCCSNDQQGIDIRLPRIENRGSSGLRGKVLCFPQSPSGRRQSTLC